MQALRDGRGLWVQYQYIDAVLLLHATFDTFSFRLLFYLIPIWRKLSKGIKFFSIPCTKCNLTRISRYHHLILRTPLPHPPSINISPSLQKPPHSAPTSATEPQYHQMGIITTLPPSRNNNLLIPSSTHLATLTLPPNFSDRQHLISLLPPPSPADTAQYALLLLLVLAGVGAVAYDCCGEDADDHDVACKELAWVLTCGRGKK